MNSAHISDLIERHAVDVAAGNPLNAVLRMTLQPDQVGGASRRRCRVDDRYVSKLDQRSITVYTSSRRPQQLDVARQPGGGHIGNPDLGAGVAGAAR